VGAYNLHEEFNFFPITCKTNYDKFSLEGALLEKTLLVVFLQEIHAAVSQLANRAMLHLMVF